MILIHWKYEGWMGDDVEMNSELGCENAGVIRASDFLCQKKMQEMRVS